MSEATAFDTYRYFKRLTESGFTKRQAETLVEGQVSLIDTNLATKSDIETLRKKIEVVKSSPLKWMSSLMVAQSALIVTLIVTLLDSA